MEKKKVCFILPNIYPIPAVRGGAVETLLQLLIDKNEEYNKIDITCISIKDDEAINQSKKYKNTNFIYVNDTYLGIPIKRKNNFIGKVFRFLKLQYKLYVRKIYSLIKDKHYDYIIIEGGQLEQYKYLKDNIKNTIFLCHIHGSASINESYSFYDYYIVPSKFVASVLNKDEIVDKKQIKLIYNAIDNNRFTKKVDLKTSEKLRNKYKIKKDEVVFLFCGRTIPDKGIRELLLALRKMKSINKIKLIIIGNSNFGYEMKTDFDQELANIAQPIKDSVVFTGFVSNDELYNIYSITDMTVIPSMCEEAFCLVAIESLASKTPIIATDSGALKELLKDDYSVMIKRDDNLIDNLANTFDDMVEHKDKIDKLKKGIPTNKFTNEEYYKDFVKLFNGLK